MMLVVPALVAGVMFGLSGRGHPAPPPFSLVRDIPELVRSVPIIIVGKVTGIQPGRISGSGDSRLGFTDVRIRVEKSLKGSSPPKVAVEQVSGAGKKFTSEAGPPYYKGQRYLLFLRPGEGGNYIPIPQGRFFLEKGKIIPVGPGILADKVKGMSEARMIEKIKSVIREQ